MFDRLASLTGDRRGATAVEYGLIMALIVLVMLIALRNVADVTIDIWNNVASKVGKA